MLKDLIVFITKNLVDHPDDVNVNEVAGEQTSVFELRVNQEDLGKIIGKQGRTARALRTVLSAAGVKENKRIVLEIMD
ncbi:MAG TPA: KH domain-containing protein [Bdellovibrionota bacterium]|nr:KH domain-containing protein [Bdellovibrionota bacterium]